jgi:acyl-CoA synthetase (AMP-forming)/AMP-acid ligase II
LNYFATDKPRPRGEICVRGPSVIPGYLKDEAKTKETIDEEGWLHSGDIGIVGSNGVITVIDRKKIVFKVWMSLWFSCDTSTFHFLPPNILTLVTDYYNFCCITS